MRQIRLNGTQSRLTAVVIGLAGCAAFSLGDHFNEEMKLAPNDGVVDQAFGHAVSIDAGIIAVGAKGDDDLGAQSGSAYVFSTATGIQIAKLVPDDGAAGDEFGCSIAISGGVVAVGARFDDDHGENSGAAYLFDAVTGDQLAKLLPDDGQAGDEFGYSIAMSGGVVAVGAIRDDDLGDSSGSVYLFDASTGAQLQKLLPDEGAANQSFGVSVAMDDGVVAVGSRSYFVLGEGFTLGAVYLFDVSTGDQINRLSAGNGTWTDFFGDAIDIDNGLVAVGAWARSIFFDHSGAAYVFDASTGDQVSYIVPSDGHDRDHFGISVAIDDGVVAIGSHQDGDNGFNAGSAYLYDAVSGSRIDKLLAHDGSAFDYFGESIAIEHGRVVVGAVGDEDNGSNSGSVYVFDSVCRADFNGDGLLDFFDVSSFLNASPDFNGDGVFDFFDVAGFLNAFSAGCP